MEGGFFFFLGSMLWMSADPGGGVRKGAEEERGYLAKIAGY